MQIIAENGLAAFSIKQVSNRAHINEALMYRDFDTKENLLFACYKSLNGKIEELYDSFDVEALKADENPLEKLKDLWSDLFDLLVAEDYKTLYYLEYRDSLYLRSMREKKPDVLDAYRDKFIAAAESINGEQDKKNMSLIWTFTLDGTADFAKRVIKKEIPWNKKAKANIWDLLSHGLSGALN